MQDKRAAPRREISRDARIALADGREIDCKLSDVSQTGVRLSTAQPAAVPDTFVLILRDDLRRRCRVAHRGTDGVLGVMFVAGEPESN